MLVKSVINWNDQQILVKLAYLRYTDLVFGWLREALYATSLFQVLNESPFHPAIKQTKGA